MEGRKIKELLAKLGINAQSHFPGDEQANKDTNQRLDRYKNESIRLNSQPDYNKIPYSSDMEDPNGTLDPEALKNWNDRNTAEAKQTDYNRSGSNAMVLNEYDRLDKKARQKAAVEANISVPVSFLDVQTELTAAEPMSGSSQFRITLNGVAADEITVELFKIGFQP